MEEHTKGIPCLVEFALENIAKSRFVNAEMQVVLEEYLLGEPEYYILRNKDAAYDVVLAFQEKQEGISVLFLFRISKNYALPMEMEAYKLNTILRGRNKLKLAGLALDESFAAKEPYEKMILFLQGDSIQFQTMQEDGENLGIQMRNIFTGEEV